MRSAYHSQFILIHHHLQVLPALTAICGYAYRGIDIDCGVWESGQSAEHLHCDMFPFITQSILCVRPDALSPVLSQRVLTRRDQRISESASGIHRSAHPCYRKWRTACDGTGPAYRRAGLSLRRRGGTPGGRRLRWPSF